MNVFVGNLSHDATEDDLRQAFEPFGLVESTNIPKDRRTEEPKGFGFVTMPDKDEAEKAIAEMNGKEFMGKELTVQESTSKPARPQRFGGGGRGGRGGGFGQKGKGGRRGFSRDKRGGRGGRDRGPRRDDDSRGNR